MVIMDCLEEQLIKKQKKHKKIKKISLIIDLVIFQYKGTFQF